MRQTEIVVTCSPYMQPFLQAEIAALGYPVLSADKLSVMTRGGLEDAMRLNLRLRTASRVALSLTTFSAPNAEALYREAVKFEWDKVIPVSGYFHVHSSVKNETIKDNRFANLKLKDAIADFFMRKYGKRPDSGPDKTQSAIFMHWVGSQCIIYLDASGESISKHGYRIHPWKAPMIESLAAATLMATNWDRKSPLINPMCGSGTLAIEAALLALDIAPGLFRRKFSFQSIRQYDESVWQRLRSEARKKIKSNPDLKIIASDYNAKALEAAEANAENAGVDSFIEFIQCPFEETPIPAQPGVVIMNPEYGERLGNIRELENIYRKIGDFFKQHCTGYTGYIFTGNLDLAKKIGLRAKSRTPFLNGKIECRLLEYELYKGSQKTKSSS